MDKFKGATFLCKKHLEPLLADKASVIDAQIGFLYGTAFAVF